MENYHNLLIKIIFLLILILSIIMNMVNCECPKVCDCKWKNGKETVLCTNVNLTTIPPNLDAGTQVLDLTANEITKILHDAFLKVGLINLQKVFLAKCKLKIIDRYAFRKIKNLVELDLSYNLLNFIPTQVFSSIGELRELKLNGNPIQRITNDAFMNLPQLLRLELSNCKINFIEHNSFNGIEETLEWLKIEGNKLIDIQSPSTLTSLENLKGIELNKNPWNCTCIIKPIIEWLAKFKISQTLSPTCRHPIRLLNKSWDRLKLDEFACLPKIQQIKDNYTEVENSNITFTCDFDEFVDHIDVKWKFNNKIINPSFKNINFKKYLIQVNFNTTKLIVNNLEITDNGIFTCQIENKAGRVEKHFNLEIQLKNSFQSNIQKIVIFIIFFIFIFFIIFLTFIISIIIWRRKRKTSRKNYKASHDYEKIDHFNLPNKNTTSLMNNQISSSMIGNFSNSSNGIGGLGCSSGSNNNLIGGKVVKIEDFPLRQYREYKHIPSDDDDDNYDEENDDDDLDDGVGDNESGDVNNINFSHIPSTKKTNDENFNIKGKSKPKDSKKNLRKTNIMLNNLTNCGRKRMINTTNWINDDVHSDKENSQDNNHRRHDRNNKRQPSAKATDEVEYSIEQNSKNVKSLYENEEFNEDEDNLFQSFINSQTTKPKTSISSTSANIPLKGFKPNFPQHIMTKKTLSSENNDSNVNCSLYTTELSNSEKHEDKTFPDLLDLPTQFNDISTDNSYDDKQKYYENFFNMYSTLPITKTTINLNSPSNFINLNKNSNNSSKKYKLNSDDSQASLLSTSSNEKIMAKRRNPRRYSIDSYSYIPSSSNSSSSFSLLANQPPSNSSLRYNNLYKNNLKQRSSSYLNLITPETKLSSTSQNLKTSYPDLNLTANIAAINTNKPSSSDLFDQINKTNCTFNSNKVFRIPSTATPLLDFSSFPLHSRITSSLLENPNTSSKLLYDYHTTQLEYFLQEYRKLQDQLKKIGGLSLPLQLSNATQSNNTTATPSITPNENLLLTPNTIASGSASLSYSKKEDELNTIGQSAKFADPLMYNDAWFTPNTQTSTSQSGPNGLNTENLSIPTAPHTTGVPSAGGILKKKQLGSWNKSPDPPPYWLHRNAMLKQLSNENSNSNKSNSNSCNSNNRTSKS